MDLTDNHQKFKFLRKRYPRFVFENYVITQTIDELKLVFEFVIGDEISFKPELTFPIRDKKLQKRLSEIDIRSLVFNIGMIELISYWKACCCPKILIKAHLINAEQIAWWKKLYFNGLGEFFHLNGIKTDLNTFVEIKSVSDSKLAVQNFNLEEKIIVPVGGGKDSVVSLEILKNSNFEIAPLVLNMNAARERCIKTAGLDDRNSIEISRKIDPKLLELNSQGFLNGHTPFSSVLAFTSLLAAVINGYKYIALSNESSANESTVIDSHVNHQYSKSFEFESDFRAYISKYISPNLNYFSFLRPLNELQIASLFAQNHTYFSEFRSCNVGSKKDEWCGKCSKCLFTCIILSPFIPEQDLVKIFSKNLLDDPDLTPVFDELIGLGLTKPFECVGTLEDVNAALLLTLKKYKDDELPVLLDHYKKTSAFKLNRNLNTSILLKEFNSEHFLNPKFFSLLKSKLK